MGNCFKNKVNTVDSVLTNSNRRSSRQRKSTTTASIKDGERKMFRELQDQQPSVSGGGLAFTIDLYNDKPKAKPPRRLQKIEGKSASVLDVSFQNFEEKQLRAELMRQEKRANRQLKARLEQQRCQDALKRREAKAEEVKAKLEEKEKNQEREIERRKIRLRELAQRTKEERLRKAKKNV